MNTEKIKDILKLGRGLAYAAIIWYILGVLFAILMGGSLDTGKFILGYFIVFPGVLVGTFTNNYYDIAVDKHSIPTPVSGGTKILSERPELLKTIRNLIIFCFSLSVFLGLVFTIVYSYPITFFAFVIIANFTALAYTAPPLRLVYRGFGEITTMIMGGVYMEGLGYFVVAGTLDLTFLLLSIPLMLTMFAFAFYVEIPDREADLRGKKNTLVVRINEQFGFITGSVALASATICYILYYVLHVFPESGLFLLIGIYSIVPVAFAVNGFLKYRLDPKTSAQSVFRSSISILSFIMFVDAYFAYAILT